MTQELDLWIKKNTFNYSEFKDFDLLYKKKDGKTISLVIPTLNEESTIENIISKIINTLNKNYKIIDEIIIIDGGSVDNTQIILKELVQKYEIVKFVKDDDILQQFTKKGKGNQLYKGLYYSKGDIVLFCDSDIKDFNVLLIYGLICPLLFDNIKFIKGFYNRPSFYDNNNKKDQGGRVTELCARPLINSLYSELSGFTQPLSGEYGGYRDILENINFMSGYSVEIIVLIEIYQKYGLKIMGQSNLIERIHSHQNIEELSKMSFSIMIAVLQKKNISYQGNIFYDKFLTKMEHIENEILPALNTIEKS